MKILELEHEKYRNLRDGKFFPSEKINVIYGDNAQGKTNLLESIWIFTGGRSFRGSRDQDLIRFNEPMAQLSMKLFAQERNQELGIKVFAKNLRRKRAVTINSVEKGAPADLVGKFCAVVFSPNHLLLVKDGPAMRRKFLDIAICQIAPKYSKLISRYMHVLSQRNALLKDIKRHPKLIDTLSVWDEKLANYASEIISERIQYVNYLKEFSRVFHEGISSKKEILDLSYETSVEQPLVVDPALLMKKFQKTRGSDIALGYTTVGPHRDDIKILINKKSAKLFASQGQQRSAVLAIKLSEAEIFKKIFKRKPVVLLDDVMSELDEKRQDFVLNSISENQVFITCCEPSPALKLQNGKSFRVADGSLF